MKILLLLFKIYLKKIIVYQNSTVRNNILDTSLELSNKLVLDVLNFKIQRISDIWFRIKAQMNMYSNKISVFNNWQMQYKPIVPPNILIVIKYVYSLNSGSVFKCCSEATLCSKGLKQSNFKVFCNCKVRLEIICKLHKVKCLNIC